MFYFGLGEVLRRAYAGAEDGLKADLLGLSHTGWMGDVRNGPNQKVISRVARMAFQVLRQAYDESVKTGTSHRNWFRSPTTLLLIKAKVSDSWKLVAEHADAYRFPGTNK